MNKRITSLVLVFVMAVSLLVTAVPALAAPEASTFTFTVEADKASARPGDTITFTVYMQQTGTMTCFQGKLQIPVRLNICCGKRCSHSGHSSNTRSGRGSMDSGSL